MADLKGAIVKALPWIGAAATGNLPALVTLAASAVSDALGVAVPANSDAIASAVAGATPEQQAALQERELSFKERMQAAGFSHAEELGRQQIASDTLFVTDTANAREHFATDDKVFILGICVLISFLLLVIGVLYVLHQMVVGKVTADPGTIAVVAGLLGSIVGYFASNSQQVINYFFGSSKGSKDSGNMVRAALEATLKAQAQNSSN